MKHPADDILDSLKFTDIISRQTFGNTDDVISFMDFEIAEPLFEYATRRITEKALHIILSNGQRICLTERTAQTLIVMFGCARRLATFTVIELNMLKNKTFKVEVGYDTIMRSGNRKMTPEVIKLIS